jgi:hypothetical protein
MLDLTKATNEAAGFINKIGIRRDGTADNELLFDLDLAFMLASDLDAKVVDKLIPGALAMYLRTEDGDEQLKTSVRVNPSAEDLFVSLKQSDALLQLFDGRACVRTVVYNAVPGAASVVFRIRLFEVNIDSAGVLCESLGSKVTIGFTKQQQLLTFPTPKPDLSAKEEPWTIVSGLDEEGLAVFGVLTHTDNSDRNCPPVVCINDFGSETIIEESGIISRFDISANGQLESMIDTFQSKVKKLGGKPTWEYMILAMGQEYSDNVYFGANPCELAWGVVNAAVKYSKSAS